jgi:hypothetical protein
MLDISKMSEGLDPRLADLVAQFRRIQVSRFPLLVVNEDREVKFVDSRFLGIEGKWKVVGWLFIDTMENDQETLVLASPSIFNDRFRGDRRNRKMTKDPKKMLKYLQTYVRPFSSAQIAKRTFRDADGMFDTWKYRTNSEASSVMRLSMQDVYEEIKRMRELGIKAQTEKFQRVMDEGLEKYEAHKQIENRKGEKDLIHVFFNPDDSVATHSFTDKPDLLPHYDSIDEVPYELSSKIGLLRLGEKEKYVPNVGVQIDDRTFWIDIGG